MLGSGRTLACVLVVAWLGVAAAASAQEPQDLVVQSTTSVRDSGLLEQVIVPEFQREYPQWRLQGRRRRHRPGDHQRARGPGGRADHPRARPRGAVRRRRLLARALRADDHVERLRDRRAARLTRRASPLPAATTPPPRSRRSPPRVPPDARPSSRAATTPARTRRRRTSGSSPRVARNAATSRPAAERRTRRGTRRRASGWPTRCA